MRLLYIYTLSLCIYAYKCVYIFLTTLMTGGTLSGFRWMASAGHEPASNQNRRQEEEEEATRDLFRSVSYCLLLLHHHPFFFFFISIFCLIYHSYIYYMRTPQTTRFFVLNRGNIDSFLYLHSHIHNPALFIIISFFFSSYFFSI